MNNDLQLPRPWVREKRLKGDASTRSYARLWDRDGNTAVLVRYPPDLRGQITRDLEVRAWCERRELRVPALLEHPANADWAIIEDLGPVDAESALLEISAPDRLALCLKAVVPLGILAGIEPSVLPKWNAPLDGDRMRWELAGFELWFVRYRCGAAPPKSVGRWLDGLVEEIARHPRRVCHRDYHVNNLIVLGDGGVGLIDFQDMLVGPDTYDLASLLYERALPDLLDHAQQATVKAEWAGLAAAEFGWQERLRQVRLQRALKVLGTFARLEACGQPGYVRWLAELAGALATELEETDAPPELKGLLLDL